MSLKNSGIKYCTGYVMKLWKYNVGKKKKLYFCTIKINFNFF